jgi:hypothetical protein
VVAAASVAVALVADTATVATNLPLSNGLSENFNSTFVAA